MAAANRSGSLAKEADNKAVQEVPAVTAVVAEVCLLCMQGEGTNEHHIIGDNVYFAWLQGRRNPCLAQGQPTEIILILFMPIVYEKD